MTGKRVKKENRLRLPVAVLMLAAVAILLSAGGPQGAAVNSPAEAWEPETPDVGAAAEELTAPTVKMPEEPVWAGPVPESPPVEDTYFDDAVFLGDSRTEGLRLYSGLQHGTFLCFTGATVESVFSKAVETPVGEMPLLDALATLEYGKLYLMLGINELGWNGTETFRNQSTELIRRVREDHPDVEIVIQSILPVSAQKDAEGRYVNNQRIAEYNQVWRELAQELDAAYLNVAECVADEAGLLSPELCYDGVHLNPAGCRMWLDYLRTHPVGEAGGELPEETAFPEGTAEGSVEEPPLPEEPEGIPPEEVVLPGEAGQALPGSEG